MPLTDRISGASSPLDGPPPSPAAPSSATTPTFSQLANPLSPASMAPAQMPPELLAGISARAQQILSDLDAFSQVTPMHGPLLGQVRELLTKYLQQLTLTGAPPPSPTSTGSPFPGGGFERGGAPV